MQKYDFFKTGTKITLLSLTTFAMTAFAAKPPEKIMHAKTYTTSEGFTIQYRIHIPEITNTLEKIPAILFLHGAGERGDNNLSQLKHGVPQLLDYIINNNHPAVLIAPQCPNGTSWANISRLKESCKMPDEPSKPLQAVIEMFEKEISAAPVDRLRLYITGLSMGGYGSWDFMQRFPEKFAAGMPICGGGDVSLAPRLVNIPIHVVHGEKDTVVPVTRSQEMVEAIRSAGGKNVTYKEREGEGHGVWDPTYKDFSNIDWMFAQKKENQDDPAKKE